MVKKNFMFFAVCVLIAVVCQSILMHIGGEDLVQIVFIVAIVCFLLVAFLLIFLHIPLLHLTPKMRRIVKSYGVNHFTRESFAKAIMEKGLIPHPEQAMVNQEKNMVWFYPDKGDPSYRKKCLADIRKRGRRAEYDVYVHFDDVTEEQIDQMRFRIYPSFAIGYKGTFYTQNMSVYPADD